MHAAEAAYVLDAEMQKGQSDAAAAGASSVEAGQASAEFDLGGALVECLYTSFAEAASLVASQPGFGASGKGEASEETAFQRKVEFCLGASKAFGDEYATAAAEAIPSLLLKAAPPALRKFPSGTTAALRRSLEERVSAAPDEEEAFFAATSSEAAKSAVRRDALVFEQEEGGAGDETEASARCGTPPSGAAVVPHASFSEQQGVIEVGFGATTADPTAESTGQSGEALSRDESALRVLCACVAFLRQSADGRLGSFWREVPSALDALLHRLAANPEDAAAEASQKGRDKDQKGRDEDSAVHPQGAQELPTLFTTRWATAHSTSPSSSPSLAFEGEDPTPSLAELLKSAGGQDALLERLDLRCCHARENPATAAGEGDEGGAALTENKSPLKEAPPSASNSAEKNHASPPGLAQQQQQSGESASPSCKVVSLASLKSLNDLQEPADAPCSRRQTRLAKARRRQQGRDDAESPSSEQRDGAAASEASAAPVAAVDAAREATGALKATALRVAHVHRAVLEEAAKLRELSRFYAEFAKRSVGEDAVDDSAPRRTTAAP